jgi:hypothetical protein
MKTTEKDRVTTSSGEYFYEILLSATVALGVFTALLYSNYRWWSAEYTHWVWKLNHLINRGLYQSNFGFYVAYFVPVGITTIALFAVLHLLFRNSNAKKSLRVPVGIISISVPPVIWWFIRHTRPHFFLNLEQTEWLPLELSVAIVCALLYMFHRWPISVWTSIVLLTLHCALWWRAYAISVAFPFPEIFAIPIVSYLLALSWGWSIRRVQPL